jgi:hypothetical protein
MSNAYKSTVESKHPSIDQSVIDEYESRTGVSLPDDYRKFLLLYNGGIPAPQQAAIPKSKHSVLVDYLYGILPKRSRCDLEYEANRMSEHLPTGFIVIGHDPGGNAYLLATKGKDRGHVYFWDKRGLPSKNESGNTFWLAESITSLLNSLYEAENE